MSVKQRPRCRQRALAALMLLSALIAPAGAARAGRQPRQWSCDGVAKSQTGAEVSMTWFVEASGAVMARTASWTPPVVASQASAGARRKPFGEADPDLSIDYDEPEKPAIGRPDLVSVAVTARAAPWRVGGLAVALSLDGGRTWPVALTLFAPEPDFPERALMTGSLADSDTNSNLLKVIESAREGVAALTDRTGRTLGQTRYDLSAHAERDRLYQAAWAAAERAARHPTRCAETIEGPEPPPIPIDLAPAVKR